MASARPASTWTWNVWINDTEIGNLRALTTNMGLKLGTLILTTQKSETPGGFVDHATKCSGYGSSHRISTLRSQLSLDLWMFICSSLLCCCRFWHIPTVRWPNVPFRGCFVHAECDFPADLGSSTHTMEDYDGLCTYSKYCGWKKSCTSW